MINSFKELTGTWVRKVCAAYIITHLKTGKMYIGSTSDLFSRRAEHTYELKNNKHHNRYLQEAYNNDDKIKFMFYVTINKITALRLEQELINELFASGNLFNISPDAIVAFKGLRHSDASKAKMSVSSMGKGLGKITSEETKTKISLSSKRVPISHELRSKMKAALCKKITIENIIYNSIADAARKYNVSNEVVGWRLKSISEKFKNWNYL